MVIEGLSVLWTGEKRDMREELFVREKGYFHSADQSENVISVICAFIPFAPVVGI